MEAQQGTQTDTHTYTEEEDITDAHHRAVWTLAIKLKSHLGCLARISCCNLELSLTALCRLRGSSCLYLIPVRLPLPRPMIDRVLLLFLGRAGIKVYSKQAFLPCERHPQLPQLSPGEHATAR